MFIKRSKSQRGDRTYSSVLLVQGERVPVPRGPGRPRKDEKPQTKVVHHTLANLSKLPEALVALVDRFCKAERAGAPLDGFVSTGEPVIGPAGLQRYTTTRASARVHLFVFVAMQHLGCEFEGAIAAGDERRGWGLGAERGLR